MPKLASQIGHIASEVKAYVDDRLSWTMIRASAARALDAVFPPHGFGDSDAARLGVGLDAAAWSHIRFLDGEGCDMCARPFEHGLYGGLNFGPGTRCEACQDKPFPFTRGRAACLYGDASRDIILRFKHGDRLDLAPMLVKWLERSAGDVLAGCDAIVPVPLHPWRLLERRYNQAAELARPLARHAGKTYLADALIRNRLTPKQGKSVETRRANVRGAFAVAKSGAKAVAGRRILLIDDVMTTGATARACAQALLDAGATAVDVAVLARVAGGA